MADGKVSALEVQALYSVDDADLKTTALETQILFGKQEVEFAGVETVAYVTSPSNVEAAGIEVVLWVSTEQLAPNPAKVKAAWLYY